MKAAPETIAAVSTLLGADRNVSQSFRLAVVTALSGERAVSLERARQILGVGRTTLYRWRRDGVVTLTPAKSCNRKVKLVTLESVKKGIQQ